jgi:hypothetical protein
VNAVGVLGFLLEPEQPTSERIAAPDSSVAADKTDIRRRDRRWMALGMGGTSRCYRTNQGCCFNRTANINHSATEPAGAL